MKENFLLQNCGNIDALSSKNMAYKINHIKDVIKEAFREKIAEILHTLLQQKKIEIVPEYSSNNRCFNYWQWFDEGIDCEILKVGAQDWQKGKIRLKVILEFISDEIEIEQTLDESPLDDIRRMINEINT